MCVFVRKELNTLVLNLPTPSFTHTLDFTRFELLLISQTCHAPIPRPLPIIFNLKFSPPALCTRLTPTYLQQVFPDRPSSGSVAHHWAPKATSAFPLSLAVLYWYCTVTHLASRLLLKCPESRESAL